MRTIALAPKLEELTAAMVSFNSYNTRVSHCVNLRFEISNMKLCIHFLIFEKRLGLFLFDFPARLFRYRDKTL